MGYLHTGVTLLTEGFLGKVKRLPRDVEGKFRCPPEYKQRILLQAEDLLRRGVSVFDILALYNQYAMEEVYGLTDYISYYDIDVSQQIKYPKATGELIELGRFYYHPLLQESSPPKAMTINWQTMELTEQTLVPFFLEIKDSYTLTDLVHYYLHVATLEQELYRLDNLTKAFVPIVKQYGLDMTLYLIEATANKTDDNGDHRPMTTYIPAIIDNLPQAKQMYTTRRNISLEGGLTHVYPRDSRFATLGFAPFV